MSSSGDGSSERDRILVVDDDPAILKLLGVALEQSGYHCTTADSSEAALLSLDADLYQMLIVDKNLPGLDGLQLVRIVHMLSPDLPILLITGFPSQESARDAAAIGITNYICKPVDLTDFRRTVSEALKSSCLTYSSAQQRFGSTFPPGTLPVVLARLSTSQAADVIGDRPVDLDLLHGHSVLVIEPDEVLRRELVAILDVPECRVDAFADAGQAADHIRREGYDLLIGAPDVLEASGELAEQSPRPPLGCIARMERDDLEQIIGAMQIGARGLIAPPFSASGVFRELSRVMCGLDDERLARASTSSIPP